MDEYFYELALSILLKLSDRAFQELLLAWRLETDLAKIKQSLEDIKAAILDAETQRSQSARIALWLLRLKDALYDIQDVVDEIECEELRSGTVKLYGSFTRKVRRFFSSANPLAFRNRMGHKIKDINTRLERIHKQKSEYSLKENNDNELEIPSVREMNHSYKDATHVVGRNMEKDLVIEALLKEFTDAYVSVIPIVGMGGMGKTTLARFVYNDQRVACFRKKLWVSVSGNFKFEEVMIKILNSASPSERYKEMQPDQLRIALDQALSGGDYLLILDDVWEAKRLEWQKLAELLTRNGMRGRIIVTTRYKNVASIMGNLPTVELNHLAHEDCLSLFFNCAFKGERERQDRSLRDIGEEIVKKCFGVPLAVETLGCMLYSNTNAADWKSIRDSEIWKSDNQTTASLRLSYEDLPYSLKKCFASCSFFPKGYEYDSIELVYFWMAHGFLESQNENEDLENVGFQYFDRLCSKHLLHSCSRYDVSVKCKMHSLFHDLALLVSQNEFLSVTQTHLSNIPNTVRHLCFPRPDSLGEDLPKPFQELNGVRTLSFSNERRVGFGNLKFIRTCLSKFQHLRFLDLSDSEISELPERIGRLKQLRYLSLKSNDYIKRLPNSICKLRSLEALLIGRCKKLQKLPKDLKQMVSLRYLWITTKQTSLPTDAVGSLKCLRVLFITDCENLESWPEDITGLKNLKTLVIRNCQQLDSLPESMKFLPALESVVITDCTRLKLEEGKGVCVTQFRLENLQLVRLPSLVDFPQWLIRNSTSSLQVIKLMHCNNLKEDDFPDWLHDNIPLELQIKGCPLLNLNNHHRQ